MVDSAELFEAIAHPVRIKILKILEKQPSSFASLKDSLAMRAAETSTIILRTGRTCGGQGRWAVRFNTRRERGSPVHLRSRNVDGNGKAQDQNAQGDAEGSAFPRARSLSPNFLKEGILFSSARASLFLRHQAIPPSLGFHSCLSFLRY